MANHQSLPHHGKPSPALSLMLKEFTERNLRRPLEPADSQEIRHQSRPRSLPKGPLKPSPKPEERRPKSEIRSQSHRDVAVAYRIKRCSDFGFRTSSFGLRLSGIRPRCFVTLQTSGGRLPCGRLWKPKQ